MSEASKMSKMTLNRMVTLTSINKNTHEIARQRRNTHNLYEFKNRRDGIFAAYSPMRIVNSNLKRKNKRKVKTNIRYAFF
jgi:hypothetical protein